MNKGFTLIELLVVVLIIGILAAIALPQYTKAVERSRMSEAVQILGDLATAQSIYFMQTNAFADVAAGATMPGDVTITLPSSDDRWSIKADAYPTNTKDDHVVLTAERKGGMYAGNKLFLRVDNDGKITKCVSADGFGGIGATAGYSTAEATCTAA